MPPFDPLFGGTVGNVPVKRTSSPEAGWVPVIPSGVP